MTTSQSITPSPQSIDQLSQQALDLRHQDTRRALQLGLQVIAQAKQIDYQRGLAYGLYIGAMCRFILAEMKNVLDQILQALALFESLNDSMGVGLALNLLGNLYDRQNDFTLALEYHQQALSVRRKSGDRSGEAGSLNNIGLLYFSVSRYADALDYLTQSLSVAESIDDPESIAYALGNLARIYVALDDKDKALRDFQRALTLIRKTNDLAFESTALADMALLYTARGAFETAIQHLERAIEIAQQTGNVEDQINAQINLGLVYQQCQMYPQAEDIFREALESIRKSGIRSYAPEALKGLGNNFFLQKDTEQAVEYFLRTLEIAEEIQADQLVSDVHGLLSAVYEARGEWKQALESYHCHHKTWQKIFSAENERRIQDLIAQRKIEQAQQEAEVQRQKTAELSDALDALQRVNEQKARLLHRLEMQTKVLEQLAREDGLTGLANRRWLDVRLVEEFERADRFDHHLTVAMIDLDDFKPINDTFSHQVGDQVLRRLAHLLRDGCRSVDVVGRYGGEEFILILVETAIDEGFQICERIRAAVRDFDWKSVHPELEKLTISIGLSSNQQAVNPTQLIALADENLYQAKRQGKDQVILSL